MTKSAGTGQNADNDHSLRLKIQGRERNDIMMLAGIFNALTRSLENFITAELLARNSSPKPALKKEIARLRSVSRLILSRADTEDSLFSFTLTSIKNEQPFQLRKGAEDLRNELFALFLKTVFTPVLFSSANLEQISKRYNARERIGIFGPIYLHLIDPELSYHARFATESGVDLCSWAHPSETESVSGLIPEAVKNNSAGGGESYYQYIKTGEINDLFGKRSRYEKVLIKESTKHDLYPFQLQKIRVKGKTYRFGETLSVPVSIKDNMYWITLTELQVSAGHQTRIGAEQEFEAALAHMILQLENRDGVTSDSKTRSALIKLQNMLVENA